MRALLALLGPLEEREQQRRRVYEVYDVELLREARRMQRYAKGCWFHACKVSVPRLHVRRNFDGQHIDFSELSVQQTQQT